MKAVVSGASKGIGRAVATALIQAGYDVAIISRKQKHLDDLKAGLLKLNPEADVLSKAFDLGCPDQATQCAKEIRSAWNVIDVLINNVGSYTTGKISEEPDDALDNMLRTNLLSAYHLTRPFLASMKERQRGHIINIGSVVVKEPRTEAASYTISKTALHAFNRVLADEMRDYGVKVGTILPGSVNTPSWDEVNAPKQTFVQPEDIADAIMMALQLSDSAWMEEIAIRPVDRNY